MTRSGCTARRLAGPAMALGIGLSIPGPAAPQAADCERPVTGRAREATTGMALPGIQIVIVWERDPEAAPLFPVRLDADADGAFAACPPGTAIGATVWAELGDDSSGSVEIEWGGERQAELTLSLGGDEAGRMVGVVTDARTGRPVPAASITANDLLLATTNQRGEFIATGLTPGTYPVRVQHLGFSPIEEAVEVASGLTRQLDIALSPDPIELEPLVVQTQRNRKLEYQGFYERKRWAEAVGAGAFVTQAEIDRQRPLRVTHLIGGLPGMRVICSGSGLRSCTVASVRSSSCDQPTYYLDGAKLPGGRGAVYLDELISPVEIGGVEVYSSAAQLPGEFAGSDAQCGVVVIWSR